MSLFDLRRFTFAVILTVVAPATCQATNYYVRTSGDDRNTGTSASNAFRTIGRAADVASKGDTVYIGAGTYDESIVFDARTKWRTSGDRRDRWRQWRRRPSSFSGWSTFHGDQSGVHTGDKGTITIRTQRSQYAFLAIGVDNLLIQGIAFENHSTDNSTHYGCLALDSSGEVIFDQCKFQDYTYGIYNRGSNIISVDHCEIIGGTYGLYSIRSETIHVTESNVHAARYGVVSFDADNTLIEQSRFSNIHPISGDARDSSAVYVTRSALTTRDSAFDGNRYGIYGSDLDSASIEGCTFVDTTAHAAYCSGQSLRMNRCTVRGGRYGVTLGEPAGESATIQDTLIEDMYVGINTIQGDYEFQDVTIKGNQYGIYQRSGCKRFTLTDSDSIAFAANQYTLIAIHTENEDATLRVSGQDFRGNESAVYARQTRVELDDCQFGGQRWGAYFYDSRSVDVSDCVFEGNESDPANYTFGIYARSADIRIRDATVENSRYGLIVDNTGAREPVLKNLTSQNHTYTALYIRNGSWTHNASDNNLFRSSPRGVMAVNMKWSVVDVQADGSCQYPLMDYYGKCEIIGATFRAEKIGLYSYRSERLFVANTTAANCGSYGMYVYDCPDAQIDQCTAIENGTGLYVNDPDGQFIDITNSRFSGNTNYGLLLVDTTLDPSAQSNLLIKDNKYGLCIQNRPMTLSNTMNVQVTGNSYGVMSYHDSIKLNDLQLSGNGVSVYVNGGSIAIDSVVVDGTSYGLLGYPRQRCEITKSEFKNAAYGIRLRLQQQLNDPVSLADVQVNNTGTVGIYVSDDAQLNNQFNIRDTTVADSKYGLIAVGTTLTANQVSLKRLASMGFYQSRGSCSLSKCQISSNSWSVVSFGDRCDLIDTSCSAALYGVAMLSQSGSVINTTISSKHYGLYLNRARANYKVLQSTIAVSGSIGMLHYNGDSTIQNSIISAPAYAMYDLKQSGAMVNDHNLVHASNRPYVNVEPGEGDVNKQPIFVDQAAGDLRLSAGSPAINAGRDLSAIVAKDIVGNPRPSFRAFEMGAFEYMEPSGSLRVLKWDEVAR